MRVPVPVPPALPINDVNHEAAKQFARSASASTGWGGSPIPPPLRHEMETRFGADFSDVRIHQSAGASHVGALAFAQGNEIHFAPGRYDPNSPSGQELLGHELAHVVQQRAGGIRPISSPFSNDDALESEADRLGRAAIQR